MDERAPLPAKSVRPDIRQHLRQRTKTVNRAEPNPLGSLQNQMFTETTKNNGGSSSAGIIAGRRSPRSTTKAPRHTEGKIARLPMMNGNGEPLDTPPIVQPVRLANHRKNGRGSRAVSALPPGFRTAGEIVKLRIPASDLIFENELFGRDSMLTILGQGGLGKSKLVLQMLVSIILGRRFLSFTLVPQRLKVLVLQDQNINRRLKADINQLRASMSARDWSVVSENLVLRTLDEGSDPSLDLGDPETLDRLVELVKQVQPDVIVFDPLESFTLKGLEPAANMKKLLAQIRHLVRSGKSKCATIIVHHAQGGKAGIAKVSGYDRTGFGRGSRFLQSVTRGQINVAPANPEDNTVLIVACGKNSNGPEFKPFAIRLNPKSMLYEVARDFDMEAWQAKTRGQETQGGQLTPEGIREIVKTRGPMKRQVLVAYLRKEKLLEKSRAYDLVKQAKDNTIRLNGKKEFEPVP